MVGRTLPVERVADRIRECVFENRVTLIIGKTGCGKSSRVPQMLQAELNGPIICTQPRRLAVVTIARHVAELTGSELGREVGFRIGQKSVACPKTKILFTTAGLLLEELRAHGAAALKKYSCLIVDELHERSVESDLLLACVHAMMVPGALAAAAGEPELPSLKLVLMSATANVERYRSYFKLPGDHVSLIQCDMEHMSNAIGQWLETVKHVYLEGVVQKVLAGHSRSQQHQALLQKHKAGLVSPTAQVDMPMQELICDLIITLHQQEEDADAVILVFLPTYRALEMQHKLLSELKSTSDTTGQAAASLELFPLHSSVDIDEAMRSMQLTVTAGHRKVILATNVAESSVTIPHVKHVIDACTTNQVYWDASSCREGARVIWASQSAADQRAGRTGRTCPGTCYRLLPRASFLKLDRFEVSALTLRSLRREVLCLLSAGSKSMADPEALLSQALDPPDTDRVKEAMNYLQTIGAAGLNAKGRLEPSPTGSFIAALPIALDSALLLLRGGMQGLLWEAAVLAALMNTTPYPIKQPFGSEALQYVKVYYYGPDKQAGNASVNGVAAADGSAWVADDGLDWDSSMMIQQQKRPDRSATLLANLAAFEAWQLQWCDRQRLKQMLHSSSSSSYDCNIAAEEIADQVSAVSSDGDASSLVSVLSAAVGVDEAEWCAAHHLVPSSLRHLQDTLNILLAAVHKFRPAFVNSVNGPPEYFLTGVRHSCQHLVQSTVHQLTAKGCDCHGLGVSALHTSQHHMKMHSLLKMVSQAGSATADASLLLSETGFSSNDSHSIQTQPAASDSSSSTAVGLSTPSDVAAYGLIEIDTRDVTASSKQDTRPVCKFYLSATGCRNGWKCVFKHTQPACVFFNSRSGCKYGGACRFSHDGGDSSDSKPQQAAAKGSSNHHQLQRQQQQQPGLSFDWDVTSSGTYDDILLSAAGAGQGLVLLLGEGDFSFTAALLKRRSGGDAAAGDGVVATSYEQHEQLQQIYPGAVLRDRLKHLTASGVDVRFGVDATRLHECLPHLHVSKVQHIVWNFPLAVAAEVAEAGPAAASAARNNKLLGDDDEANRQLMGQFLAAVARQMICYNPDMKVHVALCLDQYGRWGVDQLARDNFLFLLQSKPFSVAEWRGYVPKRGLLDGGFPVDRAIVYTLALKLPPALVPSPKTLGVRLRLLTAKSILKSETSPSRMNEGGVEKAGRQQTSKISITAFTALHSLITGQKH